MNDGGPAFPETRWDDKTRQEVQWCGMSLRDWFAGIALSRIAGGHKDGGKAPTMGEVANECYCYADTMLEERKK